MDSVYFIENFLKMLYQDANIPSYIYSCEKNRIVYAQPEQSELTYPPDAAEYRQYCLPVSRIWHLLRMSECQFRSRQTSAVRSGKPDPLLGFRDSPALYRLCCPAGETAAFCRIHAENPPASSKRISAETYFHQFLYQPGDIEPFRYRCVQIIETDRRQRGQTV